MIHTGKRRNRYPGMVRIVFAWMTAGLVLLCACGSGDSVIYQIADESTADAGTAPAATESSGSSESVHTAEDHKENVAVQSTLAGSGTEGSGTQKSADGTGMEKSGADDAAADAGGGDTGEQNGILYVYVCGAVASPGVYQLPAGSRIYQAVSAAGGLTEDAEDCCLNQAELLADGQQVTVYTKEEAEALGLKGKQLSSSAGGDGTQNGSAAGASAESTGQADSRINLNTATKEQLMTLPGIGESRAEAIIEYRTSSGGFSSIEDIQNISGIKEKAFAKIKDYIEV